MLKLIRYSVALMLAFAMAIMASYGIIVLFIPGFESLAFLPIFTVVRFIPLTTILIVLERKLRPPTKT